jgi:hypothetical protein
MAWNIYFVVDCRMCRADDGGAWLYMEIETKGLKDYKLKRKIFCLFVLFTGFIVSGCMAQTENQHVRPLIVGHRGSSFVAPENSKAFLCLPGSRARMRQSAMFI